MQSFSVCIGADAPALGALSFIASMPPQVPESTFSSDKIGDGVTAIVVTYHPGPEVPAHLAAIKRQAERVIVVDNSLTESSREQVRGWASGLGLELVQNGANLGVAAALNQGVELAFRAGPRWIASFDQDSAIPEGYFVSLLEAFGTEPDKGRVAVLAPRYRAQGACVVYSADGGKQGQAGTLRRMSVASTSGMLVSASALNAVGGFDDELFIDGVDHEFCLRCRRRGWLVLEASSVLLLHEQGKQETRLFLGRGITINDYPAERRYYQARNRLILYLHYLGFDPRWVGHDAGEGLRELIKFILVGEERLVKLGAILCGVWHALYGRRGPRSG